MMTKTKKSNAWKYTLSIPLFALSFVLMSATHNSNQRVRKGNITTFRGNTVEWEKVSDTIYMKNPITKEIQRMVMAPYEIIVKCDHQNVISETSQFAPNNQKNPVTQKLRIIEQNIQNALFSERAKIPKNIASVQIENLVVDGNFKVFYYDVGTLEQMKNKNGDSTLKHMVNAYPQINEMVDKILMNKNIVNPQRLHLSAPFYVIQTNVTFLPMYFKGEIINTK